MRSIKTILTTALQEIADEHGVCIKSLNVTWINADCEYQQRMVHDIITEAAVVITPYKGDLKC